MSPPSQPDPSPDEARFNFVNATSDQAANPTPKPLDTGLIQTRTWLVNAAAFTLDGLQHTAEIFLHL
jgi:hypothetical protein